MKKYFLFGQEASIIYMDEGFKELLDNINYLGYAVFVFEEGRTSPLELLEAYDGWNGFAEITEEEYNILSNL
jgi:hypothetical protein